MGAFDDIEPGSPSSPRAPFATTMLGRSKTEARRKLVFICLIGGLVLVALLGFRRHDEIGEIIETQKEHYWKPSHGGAVEEVVGGVVYNGNGAVEPTTSGKESGKPDPDAAETNDELVRFGGKGKKPAAGAAEKGKKGKSATWLAEKKKEDKLANETVAPGPVMGEKKLQDKSLRQLRNDTLGFGTIYVLNMASRTDKLDQMRLSASLTNFSFEVIPGVNGKDMASNSLPGDFTENRGEADKALGVIGCWRGHMNFANKVLENRYATALVMEDDADWDVNFRQQMEQVALGTQALSNTDSKAPPPLSPYGDGWDLIWLGHCASQPDDGDNRRVLFKNDKTVTPAARRVNYGGVPDMWPRYDNTTRIMYYTKGSTCTYAYAITYKGAQKIVKYLSTDSYNKPIDFGLHDMCSDKKRGFRCIGTFPQIIADHKPAGGADKDSDIGNGSPDNIREKGFTYNVVYPTRLNYEALIEGNMGGAKSQWPDDMEELKGELEMEWREDEIEDTVD